MNCLGFETLLAYLLETHAAERLVTAARKHLTDCEDCVDSGKQSSQTRNLISTGS